MSDQRDTKDAVLKSMRLRCPKCGEGHLFSGYLKVAPSCDSCGLDFTPQRADDGPAYIVILLVCHFVGVALHFLYRPFLDNPLMLAVILSGGAIALCLVLLPPVKGMVIAVQWARGMHGFGARRV
ncbi:DUF983 domain-containing protein [Microbulbifer sp. S227A]|uniref:DUF983 domain-containing protein n=1 Tax=Microbulbifer sp. S227A TaxID=3415131 RepID=UPI003C7B687E